MQLSKPQREIVEILMANGLNEAEAIAKMQAEQAKIRAAFDKWELQKIVNTIEELGLERRHIWNFICG